MEESMARVSWKIDQAAEIRLRNPPPRHRQQPLQWDDDRFQRLAKALLKLAKQLLEVMK